MGRGLRCAVAVMAIIATTMTGATVAQATPDAPPADAPSAQAGAAVRLADAPGSPVAWVYPIPLDATAGTQDAWRRLQRPRKRMNFPLSTTSRYQVRKARWKNWGGRKVRARGKVRLCWSQCTQWQRGAIVLARPRAVECSGGTVQRYTRFRVRGFVGLSPSGVYRARATC